MKARLAPNVQPVGHAHSRHGVPPHQASAIIQSATRVKLPSSVVFFPRLLAGFCTPGWVPPVGMGGLGGVGTHPTHPTQAGRRARRDFCEIWAFGDLGEFSHFSLSSRLLPSYTMRFTRVMSMPRPVGGYHVYTAAETTAVLRVENTDCNILAALAEAQRGLLGSGAAQAGTRDLKGMTLAKGTRPECARPDGTKLAVCGRFVHWCRRFVRGRGHHGDEMSDSGYDGCGNGTDSD